MKKCLSALLATMLCVFCLGLVACGGSSSPSSAATNSGSSSASESASASEASVPEDPGAKFVGTWELAGAEMQGVTLVGDLSSMNVETAQFVVNEDGTGTMTMDDEKTDLVWEQAGDDTISLKLKNPSENTSLDEGPTAVLQDELLKIELQADGQKGALIFSKDGKIEGLKILSMDDATSITSEDKLIGSWSISGINFDGACMYGDADSLAAINGDAEMVISFEKGGKASLFGEAVDWGISDDGAIISDSTGVSIAVKALGDDIVLDLSELYGMDLLMRFSK